MTDPAEFIYPGGGLAFTPLVPAGDVAGEPDTAAIRAGADSYDPVEGYTWPHGTVHLLCDEVDRLRSELTAAKRYANTHMETAAWHAERRRIAEADLTAARAERDELKRQAAAWCPTCEGYNRETTDMVCMTCGRDYLDDDVLRRAGFGWRRLMGEWQREAERCKRGWDTEVESHNRTMQELRDAEQQLYEKTDAANQIWADLSAARAALEAVRTLCDTADRGHPQEIKAVHVSRISAALGVADGPPAEVFCRRCNENRVPCEACAGVADGPPADGWLLAHNYVEPQYVGAWCEHISHVSPDKLGTVRCNEKPSRHQCCSSRAYGMHTADCRDIPAEEISAGRAGVADPPQPATPGGGRAYTAAVEAEKHAMVYGDGWIRVRREDESLVYEVVNPRLITFHAPAADGQTDPAEGGDQ